MSSDLAVMVKSYDLPADVGSWWDIDLPSEVEYVRVTVGSETEVS